MNTDDYENNLARQPVRDVPPEWRHSILTAAHAVTRQEPVTATSSWPNWGALREWLWPTPRAWAALGACWVFMLGAQILLRHGVSDMERGPARAMAPILLSQQQNLMAELFETPANAEHTPPDRTPGPRSEHHTRRNQA